MPQFGTKRKKSTWFIRDCRRGLIHRAPSPERGDLETATDPQVSKKLH